MHTLEATRVICIISCSVSFQKDANNDSVAQCICDQEPTSLTTNYGSCLGMVPGVKSANESSVEKSELYDRDQELGRKLRLLLKVTPMVPRNHVAALALTYIRVHIVCYCRHWY
jgi:hypothetical protein